VDLLHVLWRRRAGGAGRLGNTSQMTFLSHAALRGQIQAARIKPLAVTGSRRLPELPDVPTVAESGFPGFEAYSWIGIFVPAATPGATVQKLGADFQAVLADAEVRSNWAPAFRGGRQHWRAVGPTCAPARPLGEIRQDSGLKLDD
jgi:tripartite-type tricarboxylate transporter receptor subunit TctC